MHVTSIEAVGNIRFISFLRKLKCLYVFLTGPVYMKLATIFTVIALIVLRYSRGVLGDDSRNNDHDIDIH